MPAKDDPVAQKQAIAAQDLQAYIEKMSGARLPIAGDDRVGDGDRPAGGAGARDAAAAGG